jgi:hypothetical protein
MRELYLARHRHLNPNFIQKVGKDVRKMYEFL